MTFQGIPPGTLPSFPKRRLVEQTSSRLEFRSLLVTRDLFVRTEKHFFLRLSLSLSHSHSAREIFAENKMYVRGGYLIIAHHASMIIKRRIIRKKRMARIRGNYYPRNYYCFVPWLPSLTIVRQSRPLAITTY